MKIRAIYSVWGGDGFDEPLTGGEHDLEDVTADQYRSLAAAEAAGAIEVLDCSKQDRSSLDKHVQSQEDGEKAYVAAQASGAWHEGNLTEYLANAYAALAADDITDETRAWIEKGVADAQAQLEGVKSDG